MTLTRYTTDQERQNITGVTVNDADLSAVLELVSKGIIQAAQRHEAAVQDDMALSVTVSIDLSRPVTGANGEPEIFASDHKVRAGVTATKHYSDPELKPVVE